MPNRPAEAGAPDTVVNAPMPHAHRTENLNIADVAEAAKSQPHLTAVPPQIRLIGCGGCGLRIVAEASRAITLNNVSALVVDTSNADHHYARDLPLTVIGGHGSGMYRKENATQIAAAINTELMETIDGSDALNIVVFSASGGSGSVIGPLVLKELARREKQAIAIVVTDASTYLYNTNSINTLKTLDAIAQAAGIYLPVMTFSNNVSRQRETTGDVVESLVMLSCLLGTPVLSIDVSDRRHWLNPRKTLNLSAGVRTLRVFAIPGSAKRASQVCDDELPKITDSMLVITPEDKDIDDYAELRIQTMSGKIGSFADSADACLVGLITPADATYKKFISAVVENKTNTGSYVEMIVDSVALNEKDKPDAHGLIL